MLHPLNICSTQRIQYVAKYKYMGMVTSLLSRLRRGRDNRLIIRKCVYNNNQFTNNSNNSI